MSDPGCKAGGPLFASGNDTVSTVVVVKCGSELSWRKSTPCAIVSPALHRLDSTTDFACRNTVSTWQLDYGTFCQLGRIHYTSVLRKRALLFSTRFVQTDQFLFTFIFVSTMWETRKVVRIMTIRTLLYLLAIIVCNHRPNETAPLVAKAFADFAFERYWIQYQRPVIHTGFF